MYNTYIRREHPFRPDRFNSPLQFFTFAYFSSPLLVFLFPSLAPTPTRLCYANVFTDGLIGN